MKPTHGVQILHDYTMGDLEVGSGCSRVPVFCPLPTENLNRYFDIGCISQSRHLTVGSLYYRFNVFSHLFLAGCFCAYGFSGASENG